MAEVQTLYKRTVKCPMRRTNTFAVRPLSDDDEQVVRDLLDASAALWNMINYQRLMRYNDEDGFEAKACGTPIPALSKVDTKTFSVRLPPKLSGEQTAKRGAGSLRTRTHTTTSRTRRSRNTRNRAVHGAEDVILAWNDSI